MFAQDGLDGFRCLVGVVERNGGYEMMQDMSFHNAVHEVPADEAELAIDGGGCSAGEVPGIGFIMRKSRIGVLKECDPYYNGVSQVRSTRWRLRLTQPVVDPAVRNDVSDHENE